MFSNASFKESLKSLYPAILGWVVWWSIRFVPQSKFFGYLFKHFVFEFGAIITQHFNDPPNLEYTYSI